MITVETQYADNYLHTSAYNIHLGQTFTLDLIAIPNSDCEKERCEDSGQTIQSLSAR